VLRVRHVCDKRKDIVLASSARGGTDHLLDEAVEVAADTRGILVLRSQLDGAAVFIRARRVEMNLRRFPCHGRLLASPSSAVRT
jgi:hypothetical protein